MNIKIEDWFDNSNIGVKPSYNYWNDTSEENKKIYKDIEHLETNKHLNDIYNQIVEIKKKHQINLYDKNILSLACGTCWLEARWLENENPKKLTGVDFSEHRVHNLAIKTLKYFNANYEIRLVRGDVTDIKIENETFDLILMINTFHNISPPMKLIEELRRLSNYGTQIIIVGEPFNSSVEYLTRYAKYCIKWLLDYKQFRKTNNLFPGFRDLFKPNEIMGDTHYTKKEYNSMFSDTGGFSMKRYVDRKNGLQSFFLRLEKNKNR